MSSEHTSAPPEGQQPTDRPGREGDEGTNPLLKLAIELGPLLVFFVLNSKMDIYWGTGGFMAAMVVSLAASRIIEGRFPVMPLFTTVFVLVFGALTIYLEDEQVRTVASSQGDHGWWQPAQD